jgi:hypothetical protein
MNQHPHGVAFVPPTRLYELRFRSNIFPKDFPFFSFLTYAIQRLINVPPMLSNSNAFMAGTLEQRKNWFEAFPVKNIILDGASTAPESVLMIDIGGGERHDVQAFHRAFPDVPGRFSKTWAQPSRTVKGLIRQSPAKTRHFQ